MGRLLDGRLATGSVTEDMVGLVVKAAEEADESAVCAAAADRAGACPWPSPMLCELRPMQVSNVLQVAILCKILERVVLPQLI